MEGADLATGADASYFDGLLCGELRQQRCVACKAWHWPAVWRCAACGSWEHEWVEVPFRGTVFSWTRTWHGFTGLDAVEKPYMPVVIELDHECRTRLLGIYEADDADPAIGDAVVGHVGTIQYFDTAYPSLKWTRA